MMKKLAQNIKLYEGNSLEGFGPLGLEGGNAEGAPGIFTKFISSAIGLMTIIAVIWLLFLVVGGAISMMTAGGDKNQMEAARKRIFSGIIGFVVLIASLFIIQLIGKIIGIGNLLDIGSMLEAITK